MEALLRYLATLSPRKLLLSCWAVLLLLSLLLLFRPLEGIATAAGLCLIAGYPYVLILGLPSGIVRPSIKVTARWLLVGFVGVVVALAVGIPFLPEEYKTPTSPQSGREWLELLFGVLSVAAIFPPFFLGAAALNDTRRYMRQDPTLESIPNFLALYFGFAGGLLWVHRRVREVLRAG
jgi:hypothetical protein